MDELDSLALQTARQFMDIDPHFMHRVGAALRCGREDQAATMGQFRCLAILSHGPLTLRELAGRYEVSPPTMSRMISGMVDRGWVSRTENPNDRREITLEVLPAGREVFQQMVDRAHTETAQWLRALTEQDLLHLQAGLEGLARIVHESGNRP